MFLLCQPRIYDENKGSPRLDGAMCANGAPRGGVAGHIKGRNVEIQIYTVVFILRALPQAWVH